MDDEEEDEDNEEKDEDDEEKDEEEEDDEEDEEEDEEDEEENEEDEEEDDEDDEEEDDEVEIIAEPVKKPVKAGIYSLSMHVSPAFQLDLNALYIVYQYSIILKVLRFQN